MRAGMDPRRTREKAIEGVVGGEVPSLDECGLGRARGAGPRLSPGWRPQVAEGAEKEAGPRPGARGVGVTRAWSEEGPVLPRSRD